MTSIEITSALLTALAGLSAGIQTKHDNENFTPTPGTPYQEALVIFAKPDNPTLGDDYFREKGVFKVILCYPAAKGEADVKNQIDALRTGFKRGTTLVKGSARVVVAGTPEIGKGNNLHDRWVIPLVVPWYAEAIA